MADAICPPLVPPLLPLGPRFTASLATHTVCGQEAAAWLCNLTFCTCHFCRLKSAVDNFLGSHLIHQSHLAACCSRSSRWGLTHIEGGDAGADQRPGGDAGLGNARRRKHRHQHHRVQLQ